MSRWIFMFLLRSLCEDVISRLESHVSPSRESPPTTTNTTILDHWLHWAYVHSLPTPPETFPFILSFFFASYWPNRSRTIFQPAAFGSKQLYLLGYGLFSLALSLLCYRLSLSFGSKHMGHMIVDPVQVLETRILCIGLNVGVILFFLIYGKK